MKIKKYKWNKEHKELYESKDGNFCLIDDIKAAILDLYINVEDDGEYVKIDDITKLF